MVSQCQCEALEKKFDCRCVFMHQYAFSSLAAKDVKTVLMPPKDFLLTTHKEVMNRKLQEKSPTYQPYEYYIRSVLVKENLTAMKRHMANLIERCASGQPRKFLFPVPFLTFDENGEPIGHEGRHTAKAAEELGIKAIPVTIEKPKGVPTRRFAGMEFEEYCEQYGK